MIFRLLRSGLWLVAMTATMCAAAHAWGPNEDDKEIVLSGATDSGEDAEPTRWSYSFLKQDPSSKANLLESNSGTICFEDGEWVVTTNESDAFESNKKTDLAFYNTKTLELVCAVQIPNCLRQCGRLPHSDTFFAVTQTYGKYNFDDAPLVLTVINVKEQKLERVKLAEQDHWLAKLPSYVDAHSDGLTVKLTAERFEEFSKSKFSKPEFTALKLRYENNGSSQLPMPTLSVPKALRSMQCRGGRNPYFREDDNSSEATKEPRNASAAFIDNSKSSLNGTHLVRLLENGELQDINMSSLRQRTVALPGIEAAGPGIFESGVLRCASEGAVIIVDGKTRAIPIGKAKAAFNQRYAFAVEWKEFEEATSDSWQVIGADGRLTDRRIGEALRGRLAALPSVVVRPEAGIVIANSRARNGDGGTNVFRVFSLDKEEEIMRPLRSVTGLYGDASCVKISEAAGRYRLASIITDFFNVNGNQKYSILLQDTSTGGTTVVAENLSGLPDVLECRVADEEHVLALFSCATTTWYAEINVGAGKVAMLQEWAAPSGFGPSLFAERSNLLFVARAHGYEVHRVFQSGGPQWVCDVHLGASGSYAVSLPNGLYAGSPGCERLLGLDAGGEPVDASALARWRNRPAEVIKALGGQPETAALLAKVTDRWLKRVGFDSTLPEPKSSEIPNVTVTRMPPLWASSENIAFPIEVAAGAEPLKEVTVRVNGIPQQRIGGGDLSVSPHGKATVHGAVTLAQGQNWIEVSAVDNKGRISNQARFRTLLPKASQVPKRFIIAMGCSEYQRPELNLQYAAKDAKDVLRTFSEAGDRECESLLLTNKEVGPDALQKIKDFVSASKESDEVILFCAGHGLLDENLDYVFAGHQIDPEHPRETGIKLDALLDAVSAGKSLKRLVLMDTCQSGAVGEQEEVKLAQTQMPLPRGMKVLGTPSLTGAEQQRFIEELFLLPGQYRGINIIGASGGAEYAMESSQWSNGVFTSAIIEAVRDKGADVKRCGTIRVSDLKGYLARRVMELTGGAQKPSVVAFELDQDFDLTGAPPAAPRALEGLPPTEGVPVVVSTGPANPARLKPLPGGSQVDAGAGEYVVRAFFAALASRDAHSVQNLLADAVDYYDFGRVNKSKALADISSDWKRWNTGSFVVSDYRSSGPASGSFIVSYEVSDGKRPRSGKLRVEASFDSTSSPRITRLKSKVISYR